LFLLWHDISDLKNELISNCDVCTQANVWAPIHGMPHVRGMNLIGVKTMIEIIFSNSLV